MFWNICHSFGMGHVSGVSMAYRFISLGFIFWITPSNEIGSQFALTTVSSGLLLRFRQRKILQSSISSGQTNKSSTQWNSIVSQVIVCHCATCRSNMSWPPPLENLPPYEAFRSPMWPCMILDIYSLSFCLVFILYWHPLWLETFHTC